MPANNEAFDIAELGTSVADVQRDSEKGIPTLPNHGLVT